MNGHPSYRFASAFLLAMLVVVLVVPPQVANCCQAVAATRSAVIKCCHQSQRHVASATHPSCSGSCDARTCFYCRAANDKTALPPRSSENTQPDHSLALATPPATSSAADASAAFKCDASAFGAVPIPHRILHCSWLI